MRAKQICSPVIFPAGTIGSGAKVNASAIAFGRVVAVDLVSGERVSLISRERARRPARAVSLALAVSPVRTILPVLRTAEQLSTASA